MVRQFGDVQIVSATFDSSGQKLTVTVNVFTNSTGWNVERKLSKNTKRKVKGVHFTPIRPQGMVGMGFPSDGQEMTFDFTENFAKTVEITTSSGQKKVIKRD